MVFNARAHKSLVVFLYAEGYISKNVKIFRYSALNLSPYGVYDEGTSE